MLVFLIVNVGCRFFVGILITAFMNIQSRTGFYFFLHRVE